MLEGMLGAVLVLLAFAVGRKTGKEVRTTEPKPKTAEEIIAYLEAELSEAIELHDAATDKAQRLSLMLKAYTISELLDEIKEG